MSHERDLRQLVFDASSNKSSPANVPPKAPRRLLKTVGLALAALIVLASIAGAAWLLWQELQASDPDPAVLSSTNVVPLDQPTSQESTAEITDGDADPFEELRYLPTGSEAVGDLELWTILRSPEATPLVTIVRADDGGLTGAIFLDEVPTPLGDGIGVVPIEDVEVAGRPARMMGIAPSLAHVIEVETSDNGVLRAWGIGITAAEQREIAGVVVGNFLAGGRTAFADLPQGWTQIASIDGGNDAGPVWRAMYFAPGGEIAVVETAPVHTSLSTCELARAECAVYRSSIDNDNIVTSTFASADQIDELAESLRPTTRFNPRILNNEFAPREEIAVTDANVRDLLYLPPTEDSWLVSDTYTHFSGAGVTEPAVLLVERTVPSIGEPVSAVVVRSFPMTATGEADLDDDADAPGFDQLTLDQSNVRLQLRSWEHTPGDLARLALLPSVADDGVSFASRALRDTGITRVYDTIQVIPFPSSTSEGVVFSALIQGADGAQYEMRASSVASFAPEVALVEPNTEAAQIVSIRGQRASLTQQDGLATLTWEEQPGVLLRLTGSDEDAVLELAELLERVDFDELQERIAE